MQGLDASIETFGRAGVVAHILDGDASIADGLGRTAGGEEMDVFGVEEFGEGNKRGFIGDGEEGSSDGNYVRLIAWQTQQVVS